MTAGALVGGVLGFVAGVALAGLVSLAMWGISMSECVASLMN